MTWPPIIRVFFAIEFDLATQQALHRIIVSLKRNTKINHIRWTRSENLHITLKFISALNTSNLALLEEKTSVLIKKYPAPLLIHIGKCITFPPFYRPRVIAMEVLPIETLQPIAENLTTLCDEWHLADREDTPFRPHITIGRIKHPKEVSFNQLTSCTMRDIAPISVHHITLFRSEPSDDGSHYTVIKRFPLG